MGLTLRIRWSRRRRRCPRPRRRPAPRGRRRRGHRARSRSSRSRFAPRTRRSSDAHGQGGESFAEAARTSRRSATIAAGPGARTSNCSAAPAQAVGVPIIASLNGITPRGGSTTRSQMHEAGATAIELNMYLIPADLDTTGRDVEQRYVDILTRRLKARCRFRSRSSWARSSAPSANMARRLDDAGADAAGAVQPLLPARLRSRTRSRWCPTWSSARRREIRLPLLWIGSCTAASRRRWRRPPACTRRRGREVPAGGRGRGDDHLGAARSTARVTCARSWRG